MIKKHTVSVLMLSLSFQTQAGPLFYYLQKQYTNKQSTTSLNTVFQYSFKQYIDHNSTSKGTFSQRYYIDEKYGRTKHSPVFFYICGEGECDKQDLDGAIRFYAKLFHAKLVALEHRYYGKSLPYSSFSTKSLRYLTTEQALKDLAYFQRQLTETKQWTGPWIAFGGSYSGSMAAYYRSKYPNLVVGALASSAPVKAKEDFFEYDRSLSKILPLKCAKLMQQVTAKLEEALPNQARMDKIKEMFNSSDVQNNVDFLSMLADFSAVAIQYGHQTHLCQALSKNKSPMIGYAQYVKKELAKYELTALACTPEGLMSENPSDYNNGLDGLRPWYYQMCTEYGYHQTANPEPSQSMRAAEINLEYYQNVCQRLFNIRRAPHTDKINEDYYYPLTDSIQSIYFPNGELDPWASLSLTEENGNTSNENLTYYTIQGASHCDDLSEPEETDSASLVMARSKMVELLRSWLESYRS
jgi:pimeloyl-ACP methyl ester carboxylesterase